MFGRYPLIFQSSSNSKVAINRLRKQELASFTESAKDVLQAVEESVKRDLGASLQSSVGTVTEQESKPTTERAKIIISIQDKDETKQFRIYMVLSCNYLLYKKLLSLVSVLILYHCAVMMLNFMFIPTVAWLHFLWDS